MTDKKVIEALAEDYPQLYLDPDKDTQEQYKHVVLRGVMPEKKSLDHYAGDMYDLDETEETSTGKIRVVTLGNRHDFELVMRGLMAAKNGPSEVIQKTTGASMINVFNWPRIHRHLEGFPKEEQDAEFKRFISVKENYIDSLVVLSRGPYSGVTPDGVSTEEWLKLSDTIRRYHELTHVICRRLYPDDIDAVRDELIADAVGLYAAYRYFDPEMEKLFLGISGGKYVGGRLENYTDKASDAVDGVCAALDLMKEIIDETAGAEPFDLIPSLMKIRV